MRLQREPTASSWRRCCPKVFSAFKLDPQQVQFDVRAIQTGAAFTKSAQIDGVMYRGVEFGSGPAAAWHSLRLMSELKAAGITFHAHKSPGPQ